MVQTSRDRLRLLWRPPRIHDGAVEHRTVGFIELFHDLVYVVAIAAVTHNLFEHMSWGAVGEFVLVFSLIWITWFNGAAYHDFHGREDIRSRTFIFIQMILITLLTVFAGDWENGRTGFAILYGCIIAVFAWLWLTVHIRIDDSRQRRISRVYVAILLLTFVIMIWSAFEPPDIQIPVWTAIVIVWLGTGYYLAKAAAARYDEPIASMSLVERFGLFTIIVLGEVVVGVVHGLSGATDDVGVVTTGLLALCIGFGLWWVYFDLVGRRLPRAGRGGLPVWMILHLPLVMAISAAGAALTGMVEHAGDAHAPLIATWVLGGSVGIALAMVAAMVYTLEDWTRHRPIFLPASIVMMFLAAASAALGLLRPAPVELVSTLLAFLVLVWCVYIFCWIRFGIRTEP